MLELIFIAPSSLDRGTIIIVGKSKHKDIFLFTHIPLFLTSELLAFLKLLAAQTKS